MNRRQSSHPILGRASVTARPIVAAVDDHELVALLQEMIRLRSYSAGGEEGQIAHFMANYLEGMGLQVALQEIEPGQFNCIGRWRPDDGWHRLAPGLVRAGEFVHEIQLLAEIGLRNDEAVVAATSFVAHSIRAGAAAGRPAPPGPPGRPVVVRGDPTRDLRALWDVLDAYQVGVRIQRGVR
jgi:hypothetical protein